MRQVLTNRALRFVQQILRDFTHHERAHRLWKHASEYPEELWRGDEHESFEAMFLARLRQFPRDLARKQFRFMLARRALPAGCMMRDSPATLAGRRCVIENTAGSVGFEVAIVQVRVFIGESARQMQWIMDPLDVIEARFSLVGENDSGWHGHPLH